MIQILLLIAALLFPAAQAACPAGSNCVEYQGQVPYPATGGTTAREAKDRANDHGINILEFGADPTGSADSTAAIQAAIDYAFANKPLRTVFCPDGIYKVSQPIYLDPPGSMRGADGTNGNVWNNSSAYSQNDTVNYLGIPYVSLINSNHNNTPSSSPSDWQPLNYNSATTYSIGNLVRFNGVIWQSTENSNLNNTPTLGTGEIGPPGLPWQVWVANASTSQYGITFTGNPGLGNSGNQQGCTLNFTYNNGMGVVIGALDGNLLANMTLTGLNFTQRGLQPANGIGVPISSDGGGASRTKVENVEIDNFYIGSETGFNSDGLGEENTWNKVNINNCQQGFVLAHSQNYINGVYESAANCNQAFVATAGPGFHIFGGDYSPIPTAQNIFTLSSTAVSNANVGGFWVYTITTTLGGGLSPNGTIGGTCGSGGDCFIVNCNFSNPSFPGNCVYNSWILKLPGWGFVPMAMTAYNFSTHAATFQIAQSWVQQMGDWNAMNGCPGSCSTDLSAEIVAATQVYAVERATIFTGNAYNVTGVHIEPSAGACVTFLNNTSGFSGDHGLRFENTLFQYDVGGFVFTASNPNTDPTYGIFACFASEPFINSGSGGTGFTLEGSSFIQDGFNGGAGTPVTILTTGLATQPCIFGNQGQPLNNVIVVGQCSFVQYPPQVYGHTDFGAMFSGGSYGYTPQPWTLPRIKQSDYTTLQSITSGNALTSYPIPTGSIDYLVLDYNGNSPQTVRSNHIGASYGRNITTADDASMSWSYVGGSDVVSMDAGLLNLMFPGLVIGLDNGSGNQNYLVNAVYPLSSVDGTHIGYVQVQGPIPGNVVAGDNGQFFQNVTVSSVLSGTEGTTYACPGACPTTQVSQQSFSWQNVSVTQPVGTPVLSSCGTSSALDSGSTNFSGALTTGSSGTPTACTLTFSAAYPNLAKCAISAANSAANGVSGGTYISAQSASAFTITLGTGTNSAKYNYVCSGD